jgi:cell division protease FtsH
VCRFDRQIFVDLPDIRENEIFKVHLAPLKKVDGLDTEFLAKQTQALELTLPTFVTKRH